MPATVYVQGLKELDRAFKDVGKGVHKEFRDELKRIAEPVAVDARSRAARFGAKTASGLQAGARSGVAVVRQRVKKTTGLRPDFAGLLMRESLIPALDANEDSIVREVEQLLDRVSEREGF